MNQFHSDSGVSGETAVPECREKTIQYTVLAELTLLQVLKMSLSRWKIIAAIFVACMTTYYTYINFATFKYVAQIKLVPAPSSENSLRSGIGGLAGLRLNEGQNLPPFLVYTEQLRSREVAEQLSRDPTIMRGLFAAEWDPTAQRWREHKTFFSGLRDVVKGVLGVPVYEWAPPGAAQLQRFLELQLEVEENKLTSVVTLSFAHPDSAFAKRFLTRLHQVTDEIIRARNLRRANENIRNLELRLRQTDIASYRQAIADILAVQERSRMMASANVAYAAEPIGEAYTPDRPTRPRAGLLLVMTVVGSLLLGMILSLAIEFHQRNPGAARL
ncbi:hypothetical protein SmB9_14520 [Sphingosinicella microcystinivorans]|uniref:Subunit length determinant protein n=1 Tax=Sphingosinicella microcystinivorans TaxID=335406 RepID=A0AAD1G0L5_SPHMI|nr:hypothetical protein [Sphingosinicella microcystinivorans]BBE33794.1 hypothetical protein SmB9_14520 [Sphingosinicella microcystinivorans]